VDGWAFELSDEPLHEPMQRLLTAADGHHEQIIQVAPGELWVGPNGGTGR